MKTGTERSGTDVSIVIPVLNEEMSLPELYTGIRKSMGRIGKSYEIIFVDDGSTDKSYEVMESLRGKDGRVRTVKFVRNFGKSEALKAGFREAAGDVIITMDADLQDSPEDIPRFLDKIKECDLVVGWRRERKDKQTKIASSRIFNGLTNAVMGIKVHDSNCGFKAFRRDIAKGLRLHGEIYRYIPALVSGDKHRVCEVEVKHTARKYGKSKYGSSRIFRGFFDLLTAKFLMTYSKRPFHLFGSIGLLLSLIGFIIDGYLSYLWLLGQSIGERPLLLMGTFLLITGVQFISLGLIGELVVSRQSRDDESYARVLGK
ncbi:MAG: glycosyltransferase family 2 protein [Candidatus Aenigmatarchaeota archaeon]